MKPIGDNAAARLPVPADNQRRLVYRLDCGREVRVEEVYIALSGLGYLAGSREAIRADVIKRLPDRVRDQFPRCDGFLIKPAPEGELPRYVFMVALVSCQPVSDPAADESRLVVAWLSDDIETGLTEMIESQIRAVEWDKHAVDLTF